MIWITLALNAITLVVLLFILRNMRETDRILDDIEASLDKSERAVTKLEERRP